MEEDWKGKCLGICLEGAEFPENRVSCATVACTRVELLMFEDLGEGC